MESEKLPIKFFAPRDVDELRIEGSGSSDVPNWVLAGTALEQRHGGFGNISSTKESAA